MQIFSNSRLPFCLQFRRKACCTHIFCMYANCPLVDKFFRQTWRINACNTYIFSTVWIFSCRCYTRLRYRAEQIDVASITFCTVCRFSSSWHPCYAYNEKKTDDNIHLISSLCIIFSVNIHRSLYSPERTDVCIPFLSMDGFQHLLFSKASARGLLFSVSHSFLAPDLACSTCYFRFRKNGSVYLSWKTLYYLLWHNRSYCI